MGKIELEPGETQKIVSQPGPNEAYNIQASNADVYLGHNKGLVVEEGDRIRPGDRAVVKNLRGKPLYAKNPPGNSSNATLEVSEAGFALFFQPRAVQASVQASPQNEAAPSTDDYTNVTGASVNVSNGGSVTENLTPPGRSQQISMHVEATAAFEVQVTYNNTTDTYTGGANTDVKQVLPVYYIDDPLTVTITDTSAGSNNVSYDMAVI